MMEKILNIAIVAVILLAVISLFTFVFGIGFIGCDDKPHPAEYNLVGVEEE